MFGKKKNDDQINFPMMPFGLPPSEPEPKGGGNHALGVLFLLAGIAGLMVMLGQASDESKEKFGVPVPGDVPGQIGDMMPTE